jgi:hypothetical protein
MRFVMLVKRFSGFQVTEESRRLNGGRLELATDC